MTASKSLKQSRRVLITGASGALGSAVVTRFLEGGDHVVAVHSSSEKPSPVDQVEWVSADLTQRESVFSLFTRYDGFDAVVHCAGGFRFGNIDTVSQNDVRFLVSLNFESAFWIASAAVPQMKKAKGGTLLFISSLATLNPTPGMSAYAASKAALNAMVTTLSAELKQDGIRVNAVMPSIIDTATNRRDMPNADPTKWVAAEDIAEFLYDLTLSKSKSISGALIPIPGRV
jgi:NAD(P)-dependent dehydrogenase (short-subunit alcohol dehydrogenase family)